MDRLDGVARVAAALQLVAIAAALGAGAVGGRLAAFVAEDGPGCPFRTLTGLRCALCGMTHAIVALGGGDLASALDHHPLAPVVLLWAIYLCWMVARGRGTALVTGRRPLWLLAILAVLWTANLVA